MLDVVRLVCAGSLVVFGVITAWRVRHDLVPEERRKLVRRVAAVMQRRPITAFALPVSFFSLASVVLLVAAAVAWPDVLETLVQVAYAALSVTTAVIVVEFRAWGRRTAEPIR